MKKLILTLLAAVAVMCVPAASDVCLRCGICGISEDGSGVR